jgi:histone acetyltransferase (RNA polymerase elongator complex component)
MYRGCPNRCIFCNEKITAGDFPDRITENAFRETVYGYLNNNRRKADNIQIAFYGGNFTGIDRTYQTRLLGFARHFMEKGLVHSIRISTRPDYIDNESLSLLEKSHVRTVEIGAQSMVDEVLNLSNRGHSAADVKNGIRILKERGFETGMHLMVGLPGDTESRFKYTVDETIALHPDTVRIHPTIVFSDTALAESYHNGNYCPMTIGDAIEYCKQALMKFEEADIPVIRLGLQTTQQMEEDGSIVAGPFHPAFRSLVEGSIFLDMASSLLERTLIRDKEITFTLSPGDVSNFRGLRNQNISTLKGRFKLTEISVKTDPDQERGMLVMNGYGERYRTNRGASKTNASPSMGED